MLRVLSTPPLLRPHVNALVRLYVRHVVLPGRRQEACAVVTLSEVIRQQGLR